MGSFFNVYNRYAYSVTTLSSPAAQIGTLVRAPKTGELIAIHLRRQIVRGDDPGAAAAAPADADEGFRFEDAECLAQGRA